VRVLLVREYCHVIDEGQSPLCTQIEWNESSK